METRRLEYRGMTNAEFFRRNARPGVIILVGGSSLIDWLIRRAEAWACSDRKPSPWSHVAICEGRRPDGELWVIESDLEIDRKFKWFGVQENRLDKYYDERLFPNVGVMDFALTAEQVQKLVSEGLGLASQKAPYSFFEIAGVMLGLWAGWKRLRRNWFALRQAYFCSSLVCALYQNLGLRLTEVDEKGATPQDVADTPLLHTAHLIIRHELDRHLWPFGRRRSD